MTNSKLSSRGEAHSPCGRGAAIDGRNWHSLVRIFDPTLGKAWIYTAELYLTCRPSDPSRTSVSDPTSHKNLKYFKPGGTRIAN